MLEMNSRYEPISSYDLVRKRAVVMRGVATKRLKTNCA